jgi:hypothetical protein
MKVNFTSMQMILCRRRYASRDSFNYAYKRWTELQRLLYQLRAHFTYTLTLRIYFKRKLDYNHVTTREHYAACFIAKLEQRLRQE